MNLIDSHSHLYLEEFNEDRKNVVHRAIEQGVNKILLPNVDKHTIIQMLNLTKAYPETFFPMMGLHPTSVNENYQSQLKEIKSWLSKEKFYAIGEVGIDLYWDKTFKNEQMIVFATQIQWAKQMHLPLVIHARESFDEIFEVLETENSSHLTGVFHSFTGTLSQAQRAVEMGFKIGINGIVTFKNSGLDKVVQEIDLENILLETDAPYLAPHPKRGKRNESAYLIYITKKLAELYNLSSAKIAEQTSRNAEKLFNV